ncbi:MAG TPA: MFS transporter [Stellaceae bacterium]|jgi:EmrB/QacA subfamily drug resistance transporter
MPFRVSRHSLLLGIVAAAFFMQNLDGTVITTALPQMAISFDTTPIHLSIGITAYILSLAVFIPVSGWVSDRMGARTVFGTAIAVFTLGSVLCGLCNGVTEFALCRVFQGLGGAMMVPVGRLVLFRAVGKAGLVRALSTLSMSAMIGPVLGPPVGGFITTYASWRWIFFLNLPIGIVGAILVFIFLENYREEQSPSFDWIGFVFTGIAIATLVLDCDLVVQPGTSPVLTAGLFIISLSSGAFASWYMLRRSEPILDLSLLRIPSFFTGVAAGALFRIGAGGVGYLMAIMLQVNMGMSAFASGSITLAAALSSLTMKAAIPPVLRRWGFRTVLLGNGVISACAVAACALVTIGTPGYVVFLILLVGGFFRSLQFTGLTTLAYADIPNRRTSAATSFSSMMQQINNGLGVALAAVLLHTMQLFHVETSTTVSGQDIRTVFILMSLVALSGCIFYTRLAPNAGAEVSGHGHDGVETADAAAD